MIVTVDTSEVQDLANDINRNTDQFPIRAQQVVEKVGFDAEALAKVLVPVDTGFLMNSITLDIGVLSFDLGPTASYGDVIERGVPHPFVIRAHDGGVLHFVIDGRDVFATQVTHPPIPPRPYLAPAFDHALSQLEDALGSLGEQVLNRG